MIFYKRGTITEAKSGRKMNKVNAAILTIVLLVSVSCGQTTKQQSTTPNGEATNASKQQAPENPAAKKSGLTISPDEEYLLQKLRIQQELQDDLLKWAQTRFWIVAIISVLIGFFGVRALVREMLTSELKDAMRASADAQAAAAQGRDVIKDVRDEAGKYRGLVDELKTEAKSIGDKLQGLSSRIDAEGTRAVAAADLKIAALDQQVTELRHMFAELAEDSHKSRAALQEYERRRAEVGATTASTQAEFDLNSRYRVMVASRYDEPKEEEFASTLITALSQKGFKASEGHWAKGTSKQEWISLHLPEDLPREVSETLRNILESTIERESYPVKSLRVSGPMVGQTTEISILL